ncbi:CHC2 zinc finger domain-containing protein [Mucilaginibacter sp. RS28]|uniref:CHC2 zinc finger domain-containing protein n=1 Tax=Mucilaginibacter straminoryzae TaxID=2932774 RepID=A0A9X1X5S5_9SPHI|nr:CHC2 zinc finger domain-containing protein [Mucilaginibacter straminoryzae]MCJ8211496.1 CHC2 zinc finger domain-containing protein [Mucilaginibacter straminoryzae]
MSFEAITTYVQQNADIAKIISAYLPLSESHKALRGKCPFHNDQGNSLMVSPQKNIFRCFGCGKDGGPVEFLSEIEQMPRAEVVKKLAEKLKFQHTNITV